MRALLVLLLALTASASAAQGTGTLTGRVVEAATGQALPYATVLIEGTALGASTDEVGAFRIIGVPVGTYTVTAQFIGFRSVMRDGVRIAAGGVATQDFALTESVYVIVCVPQFERPMIDWDPFASRVVTGEEIERLPVGR